MIRFDGTVLNVINYANFINGIGQSGINVINAGDMYRDLGKVLHIYEKGVKMATFRYAQKVDDNNAGTEGVGGYPPLYMCVWQAAGGACPNAYAMVKVVVLVKTLLKLVKTYILRYILRCILRCKN